MRSYQAYQVRYMDVEGTEFSWIVIHECGAITWGEHFDELLRDIRALHSGTISIVEVRHLDRACLTRASIQKVIQDSQHA